MLERIRDYWNYQSDPNDLWDMKAFSKEWFGMILCAAGVFLVIPCLALFISWLLGDTDKMMAIFYLLFGGMIFAVITYAQIKK